jgi:hypothetical protein
VADADVPNLPTDVNGLTGHLRRGDDFTLSGRPDTLVFMPFQASCTSATIDKLATTDDVKVVLLRRHPSGDHRRRRRHYKRRRAGPNSPGSGRSAPTSGRRAGAAARREHPRHAGQPDCQLVSDTPIDLHAIDWNPAIAYTSGVDGDGTPLPNPGAIYFAMTPEIGSSPHNSPPPCRRRGHRHRDTRDAHLTLDPGPSPAGTAIVTVKTRTGVVARATVNVPASLLGLPVTADADLNVDLQTNTDYWFDVSIRDANLSDKVQSLTGFTLTDGTANDIAVPATLHWIGRQGIFPLAYRGWAVAGYNAEPTDTQPNRPNEALLEDDFVIHIDDSNQPTPPADPGWGDIGDTAPSQETSFAYLPPPPQSVAIPGQPTPVSTLVWVGNRANLAASADVMSSSRLGADSITLAADASGGAGRAVTRVSLTVPSVKLAAGLGPASFSFGFSPSFGLVDYQDMNGDGFPDIITPSSVTYTTQRGAYRPGGVNPGELAVTNQDLTFAVSAGIEAAWLTSRPTYGKTNATRARGRKGSDADDSGGGISLGVSIDAPDQPQRLGGTSDGTTDPNASYSDQPARSYRPTTSRVAGRHRPDRFASPT